MKEQRRHQRIRFAVPPQVRIGQFGLSASAELESLSLGGLMLHGPVALKVGIAVGCEFILFDSPLIDLSALVVSRVGRRYSARFQAGPLSQFLLEEAVARGLAAGGASILSVNDVGGHKVLRIAGGLNAGLYKDFVHALTRTGVDRIDLAAVTRIDAKGSEICRIAVEDYRVGIVSPSPCVRAALQGRVAWAVQ